MPRRSFVQNVRDCAGVRAIPHNSKCRYGERGAAAAKPKAQIILDAAKVSAASGGYSEPKQGQRSQSARGFCPRSAMRVPQPDIIEHFGNADAVPQPPERCLSRRAGIMRCCLRHFYRMIRVKRFPAAALLSSLCRGRRPRRPAAAFVSTLFLPFGRGRAARHAFYLSPTSKNFPLFFSFFPVSATIPVLKSYYRLREHAPA